MGAGIHPGGLQAMVLMCDEKYIATYFTFVFCKLIKTESGINAKYGKEGVYVCVVAVQLEV
jgi:hypothetical protein